MRNPASGARFIRHRDCHGGCDSLRLDADLVVLSACETALGGAIAGEGVLGLTRAFQFAGARNVLASLWPVEDVSTSELMIRFYRALAAGAPVDAALVRAQNELAAGPIEIELDGKPVRRDFTSSFFWAGFVLVGDGG